jgi:hypothetical protein
MPILLVSCSYTVAYPDNVRYFSHNEKRSGGPHAVADAFDNEVNSWQARRNTMGTKIDWQFTTKNAKIKLKRLYPIFDK